MVINNPIHFKLDTADPKQVLWQSICKFVKKEPKGLPAYAEVAKWLGDNQGRGLICVGPSSLGKSVICCQVLPHIFSQYFADAHIEVKVMTATEMNQHIDELLAFCGYKHVIVIDDLGKESPETVTFGNRRTPFFELVDKCETTGTLLIITTNLRTTRHATIQHPSIEERYGTPVLERLKAITKVVLFKGESLRA